MLPIGGKRRRAIIRMDQARPQLGVADERLRRVAEDRLDLGAHVGETAAVGDAGVRDVDVDGRRDALDEEAVPRIRVGSLDEGVLELASGTSGVIEELSPLVDEQRLAEAGEEDHSEGREVDQPDLWGAQVTDDDQQGTPEECHERKGAVNDRCGAMGRLVPGFIEPPARATDTDGDDADREGVVHEVAGRRQCNQGLAQPGNPGDTQDRKAREHEIATAQSEGGTRGQQGDQAGAGGRQVEDRVGDRDRSDDEPKVGQLIAVGGEDCRADRQEDRGGVQVDRQLLGPAQATVNGNHERHEGGHDQEEVADIGGRRHIEIPKGDLGVPAQLPDRPRGRAKGHQAAEPSFDASRAIGSERGDRGGQQSGQRPMGVLPEHDLTAQVERGRAASGPDDGSPMPRRPRTVMAPAGARRSQCVGAIGDGGCPPRGHRTAIRRPVTRVSRANALDALKSAVTNTRRTSHRKPDRAPVQLRRTRVELERSPATCPVGVIQATGPPRSAGRDRRRAGGPARG